MHIQGVSVNRGDFATLFFLVRQHWGEWRYRYFAANFNPLKPTGYVMHQQV